MLRNVHAFDEEVVSTSESWGPVDDATVSAHCGVVVPMPTLLLKYAVPLSSSLNSVVEAALTNSTVVLAAVPPVLRPYTEKAAYERVVVPTTTLLWRVVLAVPPEARPYMVSIGLPPRYAV